ncbi:MAG: hypothetical protein WBC60_02130, partial [Cognaticolwellia sp.]
MKKSIPAPIIAVLADIIPQMETHASLDNLFLFSDAPGDPPEGSKSIREPAGSGSLKNKSHLGLDELNALDLLSPPCGNGLALLDKVLATCSINESSPNAHALFV